MQIHFLLKETLDGYEFNFNGSKELSFFDAATGVEIEIRTRGKESDLEFDRRNLELRAKISCEATKRQISFVEKLLNKSILDPDETPIKLPYCRDKNELVTANGEIAKGYYPTLNFLPKDLQDLRIYIGIELEKHAVRFFQLLRWLEKADGPVDFIDGKDQRFTLYWKTTQELYHLVPSPKREPITIMCNVSEGLTWSDEDQKTFVQLWETENEQEPLGHQLLREAKEVAKHNNRSALLICYSALEVGIKQHISKCAPDAGWLVMYAPTPDLFKILRKYLPEIHRGNQDFDKWENIKTELKLITDFMNDRNKLAHRGEVISRSIDDYIRITEDLLFAFDVFEGHTWAKTHVSWEFGKMLGWEPLTKERRTIAWVLYD
jgi:hypothetical protein